MYLSPIWAAAPGSPHGYDVTDHSVVNPELGGVAGLRQFSARAVELGLGVVVDFVPNHMGIQGGHNRYWEDVLTHGQGSRYAHFFDISWQPLKQALEGKVLLPVLGDQYGRVLENGELSLEHAGVASSCATGNARCRCRRAASGWCWRPRVTPCPSPAPPRCPTLCPTCNPTPCGPS